MVGGRVPARAGLGDRFGEEYQDPEYQNFVESQSIYDLLERYAVPLFYERGRDNLPRGWIGMMKNSLLNLVGRFNSHRMLQDYVQKLYLPSALNWKKMEAENFKGSPRVHKMDSIFRGNLVPAADSGKEGRCQRPDSVRAERESGGHPPNGTAFSPRPRR